MVLFSFIMLEWKSIRTPFSTGVVFTSWAEDKQGSKDNKKISFFMIVVWTGLLLRVGLGEKEPFLPDADPTSTSQIYGLVMEIGNSFFKLLLGLPERQSRCAITEKNQRISMLKIADEIVFKAVPAAGMRHFLPCIMDNPSKSIRHLWFFFQLNGDIGLY